MTKLDIATLGHLPQRLSTARLAPYLERSAGSTEHALRLYAWNIEVTSAFWGPIAVLEVVVRNAIHDAMRSGRQDDWWSDPDVRLMDRERRAVDGAVQTLVRRGVPQPTHDQVVAATNFGFWVGLTDAGIPRDRLLSYETALWQPRIASAFPRSGSLRRKGLHRLLDDVRRFRNRLAHHEPVHAAPLDRIRDDIVLISGAVDADAERLILGASRIDSVLARKRQAVESGVTVV